MRYFACLLLVSALTTGAYSQKTVRMDAVKANDFGVTYSLPKSAMETTIDYSKRTKDAGQFYQYAERYLNISDPITESSIEYVIDAIQANTIGVPNKEQAYQVEFRPNSAAAFITLTSDGLICAINDNYTFAQKEKEANAQAQEKHINPNQYLSEEILRAGSTAKQAELVAKQIYKLRESRNDILTGDAENMPPDGNAYKLVMDQLNEQEKALTEMFAGRETIETQRKTIQTELTDEDINESVIARFSKKLGVVAANDLAGEPIFMSLKAKNPTHSLPLSEKEQKDFEKKFERGIVYNIPDKGLVQIQYRSKQYVNKECDVIQFGLQDVLDQKPFGDKNSPLKVTFYPELGAIKETGTAN